MLASQSSRQIAELGELIDESCSATSRARLGKALTSLESAKRLMLSAADRRRVIDEVYDRRRGSAIMKPCENCKRLTSNEVYCNECWDRAN